MPKLYRLTFDPNPRVGGAMRALWATLVPDPAPELTAHLQPVLAHVLEGLGDRMWRAREAACLARSELLPGRTYAQLAPVLGELHTKLLRVLDDVKETVREAALKGWRALCSACVRFGEPAGGGALPAEHLVGTLPLRLRLRTSTSMSMSMSKSIDDIERQQLSTFEHKRALRFPFPCCTRF